MLRIRKLFYLSLIKALFYLFYAKQCALKHPHIWCFLFFLFCLFIANKTPWRNIHTHIYIYIYILLFYFKLWKLINVVLWYINSSYFNFSSNLKQRFAVTDEALNNMTTWDEVSVSAMEEDGVKVMLNRSEFINRLNDFR